jgi:hypothetical protein
MGFQSTQGEMIDSHVGQAFLLPDSMIDSHTQMTCVRESSGPSLFGILVGCLHANVNQTWMPTLQAYRLGPSRLCYHKSAQPQSTDAGH